MARAKIPIREKQAKPATPRELFQTLVELIERHVDASVAESWKGGGDPADIPVLEAELTLAHERLNAHIQKMRREFIEDDT